jgi:hypothetical protein
MIEAGARARRKLRLCFLGKVPAPPGVLILAPHEVPRNASRTQSEGRAKENGKKRENSAAEHSIEAGVLHLASL